LSVRPVACGGMHVRGMEAVAVAVAVAAAFAFEIAVLLLLLLLLLLKPPSVPKGKS